MRLWSKLSLYLSIFLLFREYLCHIFLQKRAHLVFNMAYICIMGDCFVGLRLRLIVLFSSIFIFLFVSVICMLTFKICVTVFSEQLRLES